MEGCEGMPSRPNWRSMWNSTGDRGWCHDLILGDIWIGTDYIGWCHDQFYVLCGLEKYERKLSRRIWSTMWIWTDDRGWCHDLIWGAL
jgi:hypothetical protein